MAEYINVEKLFKEVFLNLVLWKKMEVFSSSLKALQGTDESGVIGGHIGGQEASNTFKN